MRSCLLLLLHIVQILLKLCKPQGAKKLIAENLMLRQQLIVLSRKYQRAPHLSFGDRIIFGMSSAFISPARLLKSAIIIKPATILKFHDLLVKRKYRLLFSAKSHRKSGPQGPSEALIQLIIEFKRRNPRFGCPRIAMQIHNAFGITINKDVVRRVLAKYDRPHFPGKGPSWLTFIGHMKDSLWSIDIFRCESILLKTHWVMVLMDQFSRRIIGFAVHTGDLHGVAVCCMFNKIISGKTYPHYLSSDNDPLFQFHRWKANLRILNVKEIKSLPYIPLSHPFVERLIRSIRQELLDQILFWNTLDLQRKLDRYQTYFNDDRSHQALKTSTPTQISENARLPLIQVTGYQWKTHCHELFQLPLAA